GHFAVRNPRNEVEPMRADIRDNAKRTAELRLQAPIPVRRKEQPILQKAAMNQPRLANLSTLHQRMGFLAEWVVAQVVGHSANALVLLRKLNKSGALTSIHG